MAHRIIMFFMCCLLNSVHSNAQIQIGTSVNKSSPKAVTAAEKDAFKKTTTYFLLKEADYAQKESFDAVLKKVWTVTPYKIFNPAEDKITERNYSLFLFGGFAYVQESNRGTVTNVFVSYDLNLVSSDEESLLAKVMMSPSHDMTASLVRVAMGKKKDFSSGLNKLAYGEGVFNNWSPVLMGAYIKFINDNIISKGKHSAFEEWAEPSKLRTLAQDTLYIPEYTKEKINILTRNISTQDEDKLTKSYPYPYRFVSTEELDRLANARPDGIRFVCYIKNSTDKFITVIDSKDYSIWFSSYEAMSYNFNDDDLKMIARKIGK